MTKFKISALIILISLAMNIAIFANEKIKSDDKTKKKAEAYYKFAYGHLMEIQNKLDEALKYYNEALLNDPNSSEIKIQIAGIYNDKKEYDKAINILQEVIKDDPNNIDALKELARNYHDKAYISKDDKLYLLSIDALEKARKLNELDSSISLNLARLYLMTNNTDKAIEVLKDFIQRKPDSYDAQDMLVEIYEKNGLYKEATEIYENILDKGYYGLEIISRLLNLYNEIGDIAKIDKLYERINKLAKDKDLLLEFASAYIAANESEKAEEVYALIYQLNPEDQLTASDYADLIQKNRGEEEAIKFLENHINKQGLNFEIGYKLSLLYIKQEKYEKADELVNKVIPLLENEKEAKENKDKLLQTLYLQKAFIYQRNRKFKESIEYFNKAEQISSIASTFILMRAYSYFQIKDYEKALEDLNKISKDEQLMNYANLLHAEILVAKGDLEGAKKILESINGQEENLDKEFLSLLVELYQITKEYKKAEEILIKKINKEPNDSNLLFLLGIIKERQKDYDSAEKYLKEALKIKPDNPAVLNYLGYMYIDIGMKLEESIEYVKKAVELDNKNGAYLDSLGWGYYKLNKLDLAKEYLEKAINYLPDNPVILDHLGDLYFKLGKTQEAIKSWQQAIDKKNDEIDIEIIKDKIQKALGKKK